MVRIYIMPAGRGSDTGVAAFPCTRCMGEHTHTSMMLGVITRVPKLILWSLPSKLPWSCCFVNDGGASEASIVFFADDDIKYYATMKGKGVGVQ